MHLDFATVDFQCDWFTTDDDFYGVTIHFNEPGGPRKVYHGGFKAGVMSDDALGAWLRLAKHTLEKEGKWPKGEQH